MNRRSFFITSCATTIVSASLPAVVIANNISWINFFEYLDDVNTELEKANQWIAWGHDAALAIGELRALPPSPNSPQMFYEILINQRKKIQRLNLAEFKQNLPETHYVAVELIEPARLTIRKRVIALQDCTAEVRESASSLEFLDLIILGLDSQENRLRRLSSLINSAYLKLNKHTPGAASGLIQLKLAFNIVDIEESYIKTVVETKSIAKNKKRIAEATISQRVSELRIAASNLQQTLLKETQALRVEYNRINNLEIEVKDLQNKAQALRQLEREANRTFDRSVAYREAALLDVQSDRDLLASAEEQIVIEKSKIENYERRYQKKYVCPKSGVGMDDCIEEAHKSFRIEYRQNRNRIIREKEKSIINFNKQKIIAEETKASLIRHEEQLRTFEHDVAVKRNLKISSQRDREAAERDYINRSENLRNEKWESRADIYWVENSSDKRLVDSTVTRLGSL